ncbi:unnamed protein product [Gongylonema pulchrum]|uniref:Secreted protein n=1 Tax=Gongylonema pulchrum TaxID=637853 RepID=A0A183D951_9BILA|nr:unnamed protein product [Gongylonema pulchrum]
MGGVQYSATGLTLGFALSRSFLWLLNGFLRPLHDSPFSTQLPVELSTSSRAVPYAATEDERDVENNEKHSELNWRVESRLFR